MSKLNKKVSVPANLRALKNAPHGVGVSGNGNVQFKKGPMNTLFEILVGTLYGKDSYYETVNQTVARMKNALIQVVNEHGIKGAEYAGRVALFAREHMYIRTMPIVMAVELAKIMQERNKVLADTVAELKNLLSVSLGDEFLLNADVINRLYDGTNSNTNSDKLFTRQEVEDLVVALTMNPPTYKIRDLVGGLISRADELTDLYAYALSVFGSTGKIPLAVRRGVGDAFNKFDEYQMAKYNRTGDGRLTLKNLLRIVHPVPASEINSMIFKKIMEDSLETPYTWETELSKNGQLSASERKSKAELWTELINRKGSGSIGYMALIRNLRNMKEAGISDETWKTVASKISDAKAVEKSKQLPFAFVNAYTIAKEAGVPNGVLNAIESAAEQSLSNMPKMGDGVWIILDCSGSMNNFHGQYSYGSKPSLNSPIGIGAVFSAALTKACKDSFNFKLTMFDDYAKNVELNPRDALFTSFAKIMARNAGGGTNLQSALDEKRNLGFEPDTVIVISDMEVNSLRSNTDLDRLFKKDTIKVAINLNGRDTTPLGEHKGWVQVSGFSPKIFQYVKFSRDADSIVKQLYDGTIPLKGEASESDE